MRDNLKVTVAALLGTAAPGTSFLFDGVEPVLRVLLLAAQLAVSVVTALYIYSKWKNRK